jgi:hypothetical protein
VSALQFNTTDLMHHILTQSLPLQARCPPTRRLWRLARCSWPPSTSARTSAARTSTPRSPSGKEASYMRMCVGLKDGPLLTCQIARRAAPQAHADPGPHTRQSADVHGGAGTPPTRPIILIVKLDSSMKGLCRVLQVLGAAAGAGLATLIAGKPAVHTVGHEVSIVGDNTHTHLTRTHAPICINRSPRCAWIHAASPVVPHLLFSQL